MNTMLKIITVASVAALVTGCMATPEERASMYCADQGHEVGTAEYQDCHMRMTQQYWAVRAQAFGMMHQGFQNAGKTISGGNRPPAPQYVAPTPAYTPPAPLRVCRAGVVC